MTEKAEFAEFEIVRGPEQTARAAPPWSAFRLFMLGFTGLAVFLVLLVIGVFILIPLLIFIWVVRTLSSLLFPGPRR
jgi:hypothetical protein